MPDRFYLPGDWTEEVELAGSEGQHLSRVLRAKPGDEIELFDGRGRSGLGRVEHVSRHSVTVKLLFVKPPRPLPKPSITLAAAPPKGERCRWMIEKVTELGVDRYVPLLTTRGVVRPGDEKLNKLELTVIAACKQSRRNTLMEINEVCSLPEFVVLNRPPRARIVVGDIHAKPISTLDPKMVYESESLAILIGPEGGFTPDEEQLLTNCGAEFVSLIPQTMRVETAAIALASWFCAVRASNSL